MKMPKFECRCNKCGKNAPINKEKSNENWTVYETKEPCECGGRFVTWADGKPLIKFE